MVVVTRLLIIALLFFTTGCGNPTAVRQPPSNSKLTLFMILNPDDPSQPVEVMPLSTEGTVEHLAGQVFRGTVPVASAAAPKHWDDDELVPCIRRYDDWVTTGSQPRCLDFKFSPEFGATYVVHISALDRPAATATTTVPGDFQVHAVTARGDPPGTEGLDVSWSPSDGAYRYLIGLRPTVPPWDCELGHSGCNSGPDRQGWFAVTADTLLKDVVAGKEAEELAGAEGPWYVDVYAVDRALYEYLTTGTDAKLYPVPPVQNVKGGYGAVGSWVRRSLEIEPQQ